MWFGNSSMFTVLFWEALNIFKKFKCFPLSFVYLGGFVFIILQETLTPPSTPLIKEKWHLPPHGGGEMLKLKSGAFQSYKITKGGVNGTWYIQPHYLFLNFVQTCIFLPALNFIFIQPPPITKLYSP